jgi:hypothetical protein
MRPFPDWPSAKSSNLASFPQNSGIAAVIHFWHSATPNITHPVFKIYVFEATILMADREAPQDHSNIAEIPIPPMSRPACFKSIAAQNQNHFFPFLLAANTSVKDSVTTSSQYHYTEPLPLFRNTA